MDGEVAVIFDRLHMLADVERTEELASRSYHTPLAKRIDIVVVWIVQTVILEVCNTLLVIVAIFPVRRADHPEVVKIGALDEYSV